MSLKSKDIESIDPMPAESENTAIIKNLTRTGHVNNNLAGSKVFFETVMQLHLSASRTTADSKNRFYRIGEFIICLSFASDALIPRITPAFEHLAVEPVDSPDLIVCLWDSVSTKTAMAPTPWRAVDYLIHGKVRGYNDGHFQTAVSMVSGALSMLDLLNNKAVWWTKDARKVPTVESGSPLLAILDWWLSRKGYHYMHAGAVGTPEGGVLLMGTGGSGKSTTSITCIDSPFSFVADDYCLLTHNPAPYVHSIYNSGKLDKQSVKRLARLNLSFFNKDKPNDEKLLTFLHSTHSEKIVNGFPVKAVLLPMVRGKTRSFLEKIQPIEALKTIAPNNLLQFTGVKNAALKAVVKLVNQVPCYRLYLGSDIKGIHRTIQEVL